MTVREARSTIARAFKEDPDFRRAYVDNIAMLFHDSGLIRDYNTRNRLASDVLDLLFGNEKEGT
jgi:hypothetical protein